MGKKRKTRRDSGSGSIYQPKGSRFFWVQFRHEGKLYKESSKKTTKTEARKLLEDKLNRIRNGLEIPTASHLTVSDLWQTLVTEYSVSLVDKGESDPYIAELQQRRLKKKLAAAEYKWKTYLSPWFSHRKPAEVNPDLLNHYVEHRKKQGAANATIRYELSMLRKALNLGQENGNLSRVPSFRKVMKNLKPRALDDYISPEQAQKLADEFGKHGLWARTLFVISHTYGMRRENAVSLRVKDLDLLSRTITIDARVTKNGQPIVLDMTENIYQLLSALVVGKKDEDFLFARKSGKRISEFRDLFQSACVRLGIGKRVTNCCGEPVAPHKCAECPHCHKRWQVCSKCGQKTLQANTKYLGPRWHSLRGSAASDMEQAGVPRRVAMTITGHLTESVYNRYAKRNEDVKRKAALMDLERFRAAKVLVTDQRLTQVGQNAEQQLSPIQPQVID